jgi:hypothetical protein
MSNLYVEEQSVQTHYGKGAQAREARETRSRPNPLASTASADNEQSGPTMDPIDKVTNTSCGNIDSYHA